MSVPSSHPSLQSMQRLARSFAVLVASARCAGLVKEQVSPVAWIVYLARNEAGEVYLLTLYAKSESENISVSTLKEIRRALEI